MEENNTAVTNPKSELWTEKFRPQTLEQAIIVPRIREELSRGIVDNILLVGTQGAGKTTLTRILAKQGVEPLVINGSLERGIDAIREQVMAYATSASLFDDDEQKFKVIVLEECDNLTNDAWMSLRAVIEQFHRTVRFIGNCNYVDKIPEPIQSRFNIIHIDPQNKEEEDYLFGEYCKRIALILKACGIAADEENIKHFVRGDFPDMRALTKKMQQLYTRGAKELTSETLGQAFDCSELLSVIMNPNADTWSNYKSLVTNWSTRAEDGVLMLGQRLPEYIQAVAPDKINRLPLVIIAIADYNAQLATSIDKFVTLLALVYKLQGIMNS